MTSPRRVWLTVGMLFLAAPALGVSGRAAAQQVQNVPGYFAVVTGEDAMLRSGPGDFHYPIAKLPKSELLRVDGEAGAWARVAYPAGAAAFVPAESFQPDATGRAGAISRPSNLKAVNLTTGPRGSWQNVLGAPLPAGTKLALVEPQPVPDGRGGNFYKVVPPDSARAYVQSSALRKATQDEINHEMASQGNRAVSESQNPAPAPTGVRPLPSKGTPGAPAVTGGNLAEPMTPTAGTPEAPAAPGTGAAGAPSPTGAAPAPRPVEIPASPYEKLEAAFEAVRKEPTEQAEYTELTAELQKAIDGLDSNSPQTPAIRGRLQQRLDYLKLLTDLRDQKRKLAEAQGGLKQNDELIRKRLEELDRVRQYTIVGRLSASTLFNGEQLPLMYRIQTVGGPNPRTLAYVKPDPKMGINSKLGQVVGVVGDAVMDPTLRLNVITPLRVDALEAAASEGGGAPPAAAGSTGPAGASGATGAPAPAGEPASTGPAAPTGG